LALIAPLYDRVTPLVATHFACVFAGTVATLRHGLGWATVFLLGALATAVARLIVWTTAQRQRRRYGDAALLKSDSTYHLLSFVWAMQTGLCCGTCLAFVNDETVREMVVALGCGTAAGIAARNTGTLRLALIQIFSLLLPLGAGELSRGWDGWTVTVLIVIYCFALSSFTRQNYSGRIGQLHAKQELADSRTELQALFNNLSVGLLEVDALTHRLTRVNRVFCQLVGRSEAELLGGLTLFDLSHPDDLAALEKRFAEVINLNGVASDNEKRYIRPDGTEIWANVSTALTRVSGENGPMRALSVVQDITSRRIIQAALRESEELLRLCTQAIRIGCYQRDYVHRLIHVDKQTSLLFGLPPDQRIITDADWAAMVLPDDLARLGVEITANHKRKVVETTNIYRARRVNDGVVRHFEVQGRVDYDSNGAVFRSQGIIMDVTERQQAAATIAHLAHHDPLTDLPNRALFHTRLEEALERARLGESFALCYVDLDRFKEVNDTFGHPIGDALLRSVARRLCAELPERDIVARLGGDEFAVIQLSGHDPAAVVALAERLIAQLSTPFLLDGFDVVIGASVGAAISPRDGLDAESLLKNADRALYKAKAEGRGRLCLYGQSIEPAAGWREAG
jgi:diguanylate cyclase (GGDEF)-like protein/PAS domain S-box-containing protein